MLGIAAFGLSFQNSNEALNPDKAHFIPKCEDLGRNLSVLDLRECLASDNQASNPMDRIFQIIFILFFVSPPLIVVLLFLIWIELKKRNERK
jgi:hypothetical protein